MEFAGRVAVVTGGASGMGAAVVDRLRAAGARAVVWDVAPGAEVECDVSDPGAIDAALEHTLRVAGVPTVITVAAAIGDSSLLLDATPELWDRVMAVNLRGPWLTIRATARAMIEHELPGSIVVLSSISARVADRGMGPYCTAKAGLDMLVRVAASELGGAGIRVNAVAPGVTRTPMLARAERLPGWLDDIADRTPLGRPGEAGEVADVVLAVHGLDWVTGESIAADGGLRLHSPIDTFGAMRANEKRANEKRARNQ